MCRKYLWLHLTILFLKCHNTFSDEDCFVTQKPKLQIVFVNDEVMKYNFPGYAKAQTESVSHLIDLFKQNNFEAEYAVTGFVDYPDTAGPRVITEPEVCYIFMQEFTADKAKIISALSKDLFPGSPANDSNNTPRDNEQSLLSAMLFAAVDKRIKWNSGFYEKQGNLVRKIIISMVYKTATRVLTTPGNRTRPKADGTDTCSTALIPEIEQLNQVLFDHQFFVVNSIMKLSFAAWLHVETVYAELFDSLFVPYYQVPMPKPGQFVNTATFNASAYAKDLYDVILKEVMSCDWEDPVGYNSLGL